LLSMNPRGRETYRRGRDRLLADIEEQGAIGKLATTPLLCAMLCAFYAYKHGAAPGTRAELYKEVVKTLVFEREAERNPDRPDLKELPERQRMLLLQALARYMTEEGLSTIECGRDLSPAPVTWPAERKETAEAVLAERIQGMRLLTVREEAALKILLDRSVVFRRVTYREAHFAHRSIQEYLAAGDYVDEGQSQELRDRIVDPQWWGIIAFAAARLAVGEVSNLVLKILDVAASTPESLRRSLIMLAADCYVARGSLKPDVAAVVQDLITAILPPVSLEEADMVARCGEQVLPMLSSVTGYPDLTAASCIRAAAAIGGSVALEIISGYATEAQGRPLVVDELINAWPKFKPLEAYIDRVLSKLDLGENWVSLKTRDIVQAAGNLTTMRRARIDTYEVSYDFAGWSRLNALEEMDFTGNWRLESLRGMGKLRRLQRLDLTGARNLRSIDELGSLRNLRELSLRGCSSLRDIGPLEALDGLRVLYLDGCSAVEDFRPLSKLRALTFLSINGCSISDLSICEGLPQLQRLHARTRHGVVRAPLSKCGELYELNVKVGSSKPGALMLPSDGKLETVVVVGGASGVDLHPLSTNIGRRELSLSSVDGLSNLSFLDRSWKLCKVAVVDCHSLQDCSGLAGLEHLEQLDLSGAAITDLEFLPGMARLARIKINRCEVLRNASSLYSLPSLEYVSALGASHEIQAVLADLSMSQEGGRHIEVVRDPFTISVTDTDDVSGGEYDADSEFGLFYGGQG
jgi:Leucine-rich repeat (LRR) protein